MCLHRAYSIITIKMTEEDATFDSDEWRVSQSNFATALIRSGVDGMRTRHWSGVLVDPSTVHDLSNDCACHHARRIILVNNCWQRVCWHWCWNAAREHCQSVQQMPIEWKFHHCGTLSFMYSVICHCQLIDMPFGVVNNGVSLRVAVICPRVWPIDLITK